MMRKSKLKERQARVAKDIKIQIDLSFETAEQIDLILQNKGWSQKDLAEAMDKSESEISKWMSGVHNFTYATIAKLTSVLGEPIIIFHKNIPTVKH